MVETRTFTGDILGLEIGSRFVVIVSAGRRPHRDTASKGEWEVTRREERRLTAKAVVISLEEDVPWFETYTSRPDAPLTRQTG